MSKLSEEIETVRHASEPHVAAVLLLDTSYSMTGPKISQLNEALRYFKDDAISDELVRKRAEIAVVTFGAGVSVIHDFSSIEDFVPIELFANGSTPMGEAIIKAIDLVENRKLVYKNGGVDYYRPWIFLITDGDPTDMQPNDSMWNTAIPKVHSGHKNRSFSFFAVGVDPANMNTLAQIAPPDRIPLKCKPGMFKEMFQWLKNSLSGVSRSKVGDQVALPNPTGPEGWAVV